jgi:hypothetical protein
MAKQKTIAALVGVGTDAEDGHKRITRGEKFIVVGGSHETHERMTETTVKSMEELKRRGKQLETVGHEEMREILQKSQPKL